MRKQPSAGVAANFKLCTEPSADSVLRHNSAELALYKSTAEASTQRLLGIHKGSTGSQLSAELQQVSVWLLSGNTLYISVPPKLLCVNARQILIQASGLQKVLQQ